MVDFSRTRLLIGDEGIEKLARSRILCLGLGGVGGAAVDSGFAEEIGAVYASDAMAAVRAVQNLVNAD